MPVQAGSYRLCAGAALGSRIFCNMDVGLKATQEKGLGVAQDAIRRLGLQHQHVPRKMALNAMKGGPQKPHPLKMETLKKILKSDPCQTGLEVGKKSPLSFQNQTWSERYNFTFLHDWSKSHK